MTSPTNDAAGACLATTLGDIQKQLTGPGSDAFLKHYAGTPEGRQKLQDTLAMLRRDGADAAKVARSCSLIATRIEKALKAKRWGIRA